MKRILPIILILNLALMVIVPYSYSGNASKMFFTVSANELEAGDTLEMTLNLNKVDYNEFIFVLSTDLNIENIYENEDLVELEQEDEALIINVNKEELSVEQITLFYTIPEDVETDTTYTIVATAINSENEEEQLVSTISVEVVENVDDTNQEDDNKQNENKTNDKEEKNENNNNTMNEKDGNSFNGAETTEDKSRQTRNKEGMSGNENGQSNSFTSKISSITSKVVNALSSVANNGSAQETVTYNGSDNNYLSSLEVEGYTLNKTFNKESATYFITVDSSITNLNIAATAEESSATVCVSGADNLKTGTNKILIFVTSESGKVRTYRIYVTK